MVISKTFDTNPQKDRWGTNDLTLLRQTRHYDWNLKAEADTVRTDLALEAQEFIRGQAPAVPGDGVETTTSQTKNTLVTRVQITTEAAGRRLGKVPGRYVTIESPAIRQRNQEAQEEVTQLLVNELKTFLNLGSEDGILVAGLGNWDATPDALGPKVVGHLLVTRHLYNMSPPEVRGGLRPVAALAPGVLGLTGIETGEIIQGVVEKIKPKAVIVIDALASRSTARLASTIQIADTGIQPGSGVGNRRFGITPASLGIPTIAIGVPTVVNAVTIANDALEILSQKMPHRLPPGVDPRLAGGTGPLANPDRARSLAQILPPELGALMVTPKEIDVLIEDLSQLLANALNAFLHPNLNLDNVLRYLQ